MYYLYNSRLTIQDKTGKFVVFSTRSWTTTLIKLGKINMKTSS